MFLGIPGNLQDMQMTPDERARLGDQIARAAGHQFDTHKDAYTKLKMAPDTYSNLLAGESTKPQTIRKAVRFFWPETGGDWTKIPADTGPAGQATDDELLGEVERRGGDEAAALVEQLRALLNPEPPKHPESGGSATA